MRLTRETLLKVARENATQRARVSRRIICIYLTGSVLGEDPLLGGTTDIDLIFVHDSEPLQKREMVRLSDEVHLDIGHYPESIFHQPRHLRADPWLGPFIYSKPLVLHDTRHWFDFMQAATGAQFYQPDYTLQRARSLAQIARQIWMDLTMQDSASLPDRVRAYLRALENAGNAIAVLTGEPLTERRFFTRFAQRAQAIHHPEVSAHLMEMVTGSTSQLDALWPGWNLSWKEAIHRAGKREDPHPRLHASRHSYYERAAASLWEDHPIAALWILLRTWTEAVQSFDPEAPEMAPWKEACQALSLDEEHFPQRAEALDVFIDQIDEVLDNWGKANGVNKE